MQNSYGVSPDEVGDTVERLIKARIVTKVPTTCAPLTNEEADRYDRQISYFSEFFENDMQAFEAQKKLMDSKLLILGCGAVGGDIAIELAMMGVSHFTLYDYDVVELSDAARHMFFQIMI